MTAGVGPETVADMVPVLLTQKQAAAMLAVSVSYLRASSCPKVLLPSGGKVGKPVVRYQRQDVLAWCLARRT
jgi:hypothetical protein